MEVSGRICFMRVHRQIEIRASRWHIYHVCMNVYIFLGRTQYILVEKEGELIADASGEKRVEERRALFPL